MMARTGVVTAAWLALAGCDSAGTAPGETATSATDASTATAADTSATGATGATDATTATATEPADTATATGEDVAQDVGPEVVNPTGGKLTFAIEPITVGVGDERQVCKYVNIPEGPGVDIVRIESRMSGKSHHFNLYKVIDASRLDPVTGADGETRDCAPANEQLGGDAAYIFGSATPDRVMQTPPGVAYHLEGGQRLILEYHGINYTTEPMVGDVAVDLVMAASDATITHYADIGWMANWAFFLPMDQESSSTKSCAVPYDMDVFSLMSHFHELGTHFTIETVVDGAATVVYEDDDWAHPKVEVYDPPLFLKKGDRIRWTCTWFNWRDGIVGPGKNSTDEMCMVFAGAYPRDSENAEPWQCNLLF